MDKWRVREQAARMMQDFNSFWERERNRLSMTRRTIDTAEKACIWNDAIQTAIDQIEPNEIHESRHCFCLFIWIQQTLTLKKKLRSLFIDASLFRSELENKSPQKS
jgi:hypothetical protein